MPGAPRQTEKPGFEVLEAGAQPPCLKPDFGFCRGCFGWQNMIEAALAGDPVWCRATIHCSETGLTVRCRAASRPRN